VQLRSRFEIFRRGKFIQEGVVQIGINPRELAMRIYEFMGIV
jgi:hypothetical protein